MALKPGTLSDFGNSMAQEMEKAFMANWPLVMGDAALPESNNQMKLMFIAIAKGVVKHLNDNPSSFEITTTVDGSSINTHGTVSNIKTNPDPLT